MINGNACWKREPNSITSLFGEIKENSKFTIRNNSEYDRVQYNYDKQFLTRINGEMCIYNTIKIIERYQPKVFVIETQRMDGYGST